MRLTDRETAALIWNTMYPDRRTFDNLEEDTKVEWERLANIANSVSKLEGMNSEDLTTIKSLIKV